MFWNLNPLKEWKMTEFFPVFVSQTVIPNVPPFITVNIFHGPLLFEYHKYNFISRSDNFFEGLKLILTANAFTILVID